MKIEFFKYSATRNDFVVIDNREKIISIENNEWVKRVCDRKSGIGADGIILIEKSDELDFKFTYANADGFEVSMCGNGTRAATHFAIKELLLGSDNQVKFQSKAGLHIGKFLDDTVKVQMTDPVELNHDLSFIDQKRKAKCIDTGVPHLCLLSNDVLEENLEKIGSVYRYHKTFSPEGINVNLVQVLSDSELFIRTYERGVEGETDACGTGAVASAILFGANKSLKVKMKGGELVISKEGDQYFLSGKVQQVFKGVINKHFY